MFNPFKLPALPAPFVINPWSLESCGSVIGTPWTSAGSAAWPTANLAIYVPFHLDQQDIVTKMVIALGGAVAGNIDVGIYSSDGRLIVSAGSTAMAGTASTRQSVDITDTLLDVGDYYMALACSSTSAQIYRAAPGLTRVRSCGIMQQASALALPTSMTPVTATNSYIPLFGLLIGRTVL